MNIKKMIKLKGILLLCLVWVCVFALPVQSQTATPVPTPAPTALTCTANDIADATDYVLNADCSAAGTAINVAAGETATVDGGGFTISGATGIVINVNGAGASLTVSNLTISGATTSNDVISVNGGASLTLNNVTISGSGVAGQRVIWVFGSGSSLIAEDLILSGNAGRPLTVSDAGSTAELTNAQFLNNAVTESGGEASSALSINNATASVTINGATFTGNRGAPQAIFVTAGSLTMTGCIRVSGNTDSAGEPAAFTNGRGGTTIIGGPGGCPRPQKKKKDDPTPAPTATERPPTPATCMGLHAATGIVVNAAFGLNSGVQCQQLDGGGIGIQALAANYIAAVDIWGYVDQGVEVCFPGIGRIIYLDASTMPRAMSLLPTHGAENGITCASIESPGSLVLLPPE